ncbi:MAG TPA: hypothetical protein VH968_14040 [Gaiellaceae bacterium]
MRALLISRLVIRIVAGPVTSPALHALELQTYNAPATAKPAAVTST